MPRLPVLTSKKVIQILKHNGFVLDHVSGSHYVFYNQVKERRVTMPFHNKDLPKGTLKSIILQSGIGTEKFL